MKMLIYFYLIYIVFLSSEDLISLNNKQINLYLIGFVNESDGIGQISLNLLDIYNDNAKVKLIKTRACNEVSSRPYLKNILRNSIDLKTTNNTSIFDQNSITIFTDILWTPFWDKLLSIKNPGIKYAYSMTEYTQVPRDWVTQLNKYFDAVLVPDKFLIRVYKNSGVKIPVFVLPLPVKLDDFLDIPDKITKNTPFVFGCSAAFYKRKNHTLLIEAFAQEFLNDPNVILKLHGRYGDYKTLEEKIKELNITNIEIINKSFSRDEYINFFINLDSYVFIPKGEGYSITPREALAIGIPCILSNNTTHKTICESNTVYAVDSNKLEPAFSEAANQSIGFDFNCEISDVRRALRQVYENYNFYLNKAKKGRIWVKRYIKESLQNKYLTLINPKKVLLGKLNTIGDDFIITDSKEFYNKYLRPFVEPHIS